MNCVVYGRVWSWTSRWSREHFLFLQENKISSSDWIRTTTVLCTKSDTHLISHTSARQIYDLSKRKIYRVCEEQINTFLIHTFLVTFSTGFRKTWIAISTLRFAYTFFCTLSWCAFFALSAQNRRIDTPYFSSVCLSAFSMSISCLVLNGFSYHEFREYA